MARFYVGQRVKLVKPNDPKFYGDTGTITAFLPERIRGCKEYSYPTNCDVKWDKEAHWTILTVSHTDRIEPLTDTYNVTTWDTCIWKPSHLREGEKVGDAP